MSVPLTQALGPIRYTSMHTPSSKRCSICGVLFPMSEFTYGSMENRSYCKSCFNAEPTISRRDGLEAARLFREDMRRKWQ